MILNDVRFHPLSKKITLFVGSILLTNIVTAHKCFVCGPISSNADAIPSCDRFNPNDSKFIRECSSDSKGCSLRTNGTVLTRTCETVAFLQCKTANNVEYCYCISELCNKWHPAQTDDEDNEPEGSGHKVGVEMIPVITDVTRHLTPTTPPIHVTEAIPTNSSKSLHNTMHQIDTLLIIFIVYCYEFLS